MSLYVSRAVLVLIAASGLVSVNAHAIPRIVKCTVDYSKAKLQPAEFNAFESIEMDFFAPQAGHALITHVESADRAKATVYSNPENNAEVFHWYESFNDRYNTVRAEGIDLVRHSADSLELHKDRATKTWTLKRMTYWVQGLHSGCQPREDQYCDDGSDLVMEISGVVCTDTYDSIVYDPRETEELIKSDPCNSGI